MARRKQVFEAPGHEEMPLPIAESPWHFGRSTYIPGEHWDLIIEFAQEKMPKFGELLEEASFLDGDFSNWTNEKTKRLYEGLQKLCTLILESEPLAPEITDEILEDQSPEGHVDMIKTVMAVIEESQRMNQMFDSYMDS